MAKREKPRTRPTHPSIERARKIAWVMDSAITIPVLRKKIGLDPLLDLIPVGGDVISSLVGCYILWVAYELRLPKHIIVRMGVNLIVDCLIGLIPLVGGLADAMWKSNKWNFEILEDAYEQYGAGIRLDREGHATLDTIAEPI